MRYPANEFGINSLKYEIRALCALVVGGEICGAGFGSFSLLFI